MTNSNIERSGDLMDKVSASQPRDRGFEPHMCHDNDSLLVPGSGLESN